MNLSLKDKLLYPLLVAVTAGLILLFIDKGFFSTSEPKANGMEKKEALDVPKTIVKLSEKIEQPIKPRNRFYFQSNSTYDLFGGDLSLAIPTWLEYSNSKIELKLSVKGKETVSYKGLSIGEKVFFEKYEITFIGTRKNISTYDVVLKILEI